MDLSLTGADVVALKAEIARLRGEVERLEREVEQLDRLSCMDALVPAANRRGLTKQLGMVLARQDRHGVPAAMLFVDVDGLKQLNDSHGHAAGDAALIYLTDLMTGEVRQSDLVARIGGDEFAILLDHAEEQVAVETARRLADRVADGDFIYKGQPLGLSVAIGLTMIAAGDTPESVLDRADRAMYRVKAAA